MALSTESTHGSALLRPLLDSKPYYPNHMASLEMEIHSSERIRVLDFGKESSSPLLYRRKRGVRKTVVRWNNSIYPTTTLMLL